MAIRHPRSGCLFCRQCLVGRRRLTIGAGQRLDTAPSISEDDRLLPSNCDGGLDGASTAVLSRQFLKRPKLQIPVNGIRDALLSFEALYERRDMRVEVLRGLSNPWPERSGTGKHPGEGGSEKMKTQQVGANGEPIPHAVFRQILKEASGEKNIRRILRTQLLRCEKPREVLRVLAAAMLNKNIARNLASQHEPLIRASYRCRNKVTDPEVLKLINVMVTRLMKAGLEVDPSLIILGLKFAARTRSLSAMKRYLKMFRESRVTMSSHVFRSVIAKCSIGYRGLGEVRNGRWDREELLQVLVGFEDCSHLPPEQQFHLGTFLNREDWKYLHGWIAILARCKDANRIWHEWQLWKETPPRLQPRKLHIMRPDMTSERRGYYWFIEQMALSGDIPRAWELVKITGFAFSKLKPRVTSRLLERIEAATVWDQSVRSAMMAKYDRDLARIEEALGVKWICTDNETEKGFHELIMPQEEALEKLSEDNWKLEEDYGFPYDAEGSFVSPTDRALHEAEELELVGDGSEN